MTARITNADVPRMLREMSHAAVNVAEDFWCALSLAHNSGPVYALEAAGTAWGIYARKLTNAERERAWKLYDALRTYARDRYEIRDRWGQ